MIDYESAWKELKTNITTFAHYDTTLPKTVTFELLQGMVLDILKKMDKLEIKHKQM